MFGCWYQVAMLTVEAQQVMWLRALKLAAGGGPADTEARRMASEKVTAATQAYGRLMCGASAESAVKSYRKKVRANWRRLTK